MDAAGHSNVSVVPDSEERKLKTKSEQTMGSAVCIPSLTSFKLRSMAAVDTRGRMNVVR